MGATGPLLEGDDSGCSALASVTERIGKRYVRLRVRGQGSGPYDSVCVDQIVGCGTSGEMGTLGFRTLHFEAHQN